MKRLFINFSKKNTLLLAVSLMFGMSVNAQDVALTVEDAALNAADLSGTYVIQEPSGLYMSSNITVGNPADANYDPAALAYDGPHFALDIVKASETTYYIQSGDKKAAYKIDNVSFDEFATENIEWKITVVNGNTVNIQRASDDAFLTTTGTDQITFLSNGTEAVNFVMKKVTSKRPVALPVEGSFTSEIAALNAADLSGRYLVQLSVGKFMSTVIGTEADPSLTASDTPLYALDFTKQDDGSYTISAGDMFANNMHGWHVQFNMLPSVNHTWKVLPVEGGAVNEVTIQRSRDNGYLKNEPNGPSAIYKFYADAGADKDVKYQLLKVTSSVSDKAALTASISAAQTLHDGADASKAAAKAILLAVITKANAVKNNAAATQTDVDQYVAELAAATIMFNRAGSSAVSANVLSEVAVAQNPVKDVLTITNTSEVASVAIYTTLGQQVLAQAVQASTISISVKNFQAGLYLVKLTDANGNAKTLKIKVD